MGAGGGKTRFSHRAAQRGKTLLLSALLCSALLCCGGLPLLAVSVTFTSR